MRNKYVLDLLTKEVHKDDCECVDEILPNNIKSLGNLRYTLEAVIKANNLGYKEAICTCDNCKDKN